MALAGAMLGLATDVARGQETPAEPSSYEAVASAEGFRFSFGAPGFVAVDTFLDAGGPISQSAVDGLGNSRAFASLPYPGDLAVSGPGLLAGLTGLPSPPPYPFYVASSHPTTPEAKLTQPGYELSAVSAESSSRASTLTGGRSGEGDGASSIGQTVTSAETSRDAASGAVTAVATGKADVVNIGGVLRIGQVDARAKVTRTPGGEPKREAQFAISGMTIAGQTVGFSDKGLTFGGSTTPIPAGNPLTDALARAKIHVQYLARVDSPDGVVSPGLVISQEQATPGGPTMVLRYTFGRMAASAIVSGGLSTVADAVPAFEPGPSPRQEIGSPVPAETAEGLSAVTDPAGAAGGPDPGPDGTGGYGGSGSASYDAVEGAANTPGSVPADAISPAESGAAEPSQQAAPISGTPMTVDTTSIYLILVAGAAAALFGGTVLRLMGVKLKWTS